MITRLRMKNFRCFDRHTLPLRPTTIIVGRNNAGKSTVIEALRLISLVANRCHGLAFRDVPDWLPLPRAYRGVTPSLQGTDLSFDTVFHRYGEPPASVTAMFSNGSIIEAYVGSLDRVYAVIKDPKGDVVKDKGHAGRLNLPPVMILPQIGPLEHEECILQQGYVQDSLSSTLASRHFRNQINLLFHFYPQFKDLAEKTWPGLRIRELQGRGVFHGKPLHLAIQDADFVAEAGAMGHGLQMWLQTIWFLARCEKEATVILDEPDVYMHADLQRRLIRLLRGRHRQVIIATHSIEIMSEVDAEEILVVDHKNPHSRFASSLPAVQRIIDSMGGVHNLQLARLWNSRRCLLVEGGDISVLKPIYDRLFPESREPLDSIPHWSIEGWGGWSHAVGSDMGLKNAVGQEIISYCIMDRDYHVDSELNKRLDEAEQRQVQLHFWQYKEIENYLLVPEAMARVINACKPRSKPAATAKEIMQKVGQISEDAKDDIIASMSDSLQKDLRCATKTAVSKAQKQVNASWATWDGRLPILPGKDVLGKLNNWSQQTWGVPLHASRVAQELRSEEIADEIVAVLTAIQKGECFA